MTESVNNTTGNEVVDIELNGVIYKHNFKTDRYSKTENGKTKRISANEYDQAMQEVIRTTTESFKRQVESYKEQTEDESPSEETKAKEAPKKAKKRPSRKPKLKEGGFKYDEDGKVIILTPKQVRFINGVTHSDFWENGLKSSVWVDYLADELAEEFNPMAVGAMVSTLREKGLVLTAHTRVNGKKACSMELTDLGKLIVNLMFHKGVLK